MCRHHLGPALPPCDSGAAHDHPGPILALDLSRSLRPVSDLDLWHLSPQPYAGGRERDLPGGRLHPTFNPSLGNLPSPSPVLT